MELRGLGYVGIGSREPEAWRHLGVDIMGLMPGDGPPTAEPGPLWFRMDERCWRVAVHPGEADAFMYAGWELPNRGAFEAGVDELQRCGVKVRRGSEALRATRGVADVAQFDDPFDNHHEIFYGAMIDETPFAAPHAGGGFVTDGVGMGHALYVVPSSSDALDFFVRIMGFRVTDEFAWGPFGAVFLHATPRHHSIAWIDLPLPGGPGLNHVMIEAASLADVGRAYDRAIDAKVPIVNSLGQHSNDPMLSFYVGAPGGFNVELGWNGLMIDERTWNVRTYTGRGELWGHRGDFMDSIAEAKDPAAP